MPVVVIGLSASPVITSTLCSEGCPSSLTWKARCCRAYRPRFDTPAILALIRKRMLHLLSAPSELYAEPLTIVVNLQGPDGHCGLWTPAGCRLTPDLRPQSCRDYFCRIASAGRDPAFCKAYREYLAVLALIKRCEEEYADLWTLAQHILWRDLLGDGVRGVIPLGTDSLESVMDGYGRYRQCLKNRVRALFGTDEKTCALTIDFGP